jgi:8-amino-7-oxononanoate synthase
MTAFPAHQADLARLEAIARRRSLAGRHGADFASNDYLGLAASPQLAEAVQAALDRGVPVGAGGSRLLRGNHPEHEALEAEAAAFFGSESALYFSSGFAANAALFAALPQRGDLVVYDELIHASSLDGMKLGRAECVAVQHNNADAFEAAITHWRAGGGRGQAWLAAESLYSMDGDRAPLDDLAAIAARHQGALLIDEAHATGVFGPDGRGLAAHLDGQENVIVLRTCGKALGCEGALICAPAVVSDFLVNRGRGMIFSTAPSPLMAAAARAALGLLRSEPARRSALWQKVRLAEAALGQSGIEQTGSQILPVMIGEDARAMRIAAELQAQGFDVRGIRPPTVPQGTARLRIAITLNAADEAIAALGQALAQALQPAGD